MTYPLICSECERTYEPSSFAWRCVCGGLLDLAPFPIDFPLATIRTRPPTLWRYRETFPFASSYLGWQAVTLGEGMTPLLPLNIQTPQVLLKMDYVMPPLSFKDRGAVLLIAKALELGVTKVVADSSGNAGTAIAAYAARAGIACEVYVSQSTSAKKVKQIAAHGASVHLIAGNREETAAAAKEAVEQDGIFYASHVYNPFFLQGTKTYAFEIWEQLNGKLPKVCVFPVGNGTLLLGAYYGFKELLSMGMIEATPRFLAVQAEHYAPLAQAFQRGERRATSVINMGTVAEGIATASPARSRQILAAVSDTGWAIITVSETAIEEARRYLAERGWYIEPTAAVSFAGFMEYIKPLASTHQRDAPRRLFAQNPFDPAADERVIIPLCGAGLKAG
jgi:threonine synthase